MPRKVTLQIKNEGLELLKKHSIRETTRIINTRYSLDLNPTTILRWKKQEDFEKYGSHESREENHKLFQSSST